MSLLPRTYAARKQIKDVAGKGMAVAELEYVGLNVRVINALEESEFNIVYLSDLIALKEDELLTIQQIGATGLGLIKQALLRVGEVEGQRHRWSHGSDKVAFYKQNIRNTVLT
jgi:DNA-directed RNA polymerase alpha subunit